jgi:hypothetical protein
MSRSISTEEQDEPLEALLQQQRDQFVRFYNKNRDLFTPREEAEAFRYFDAEGEETHSRTTLCSPRSLSQ